MAPRSLHRRLANPIYCENHFRRRYWRRGRSSASRRARRLGGTHEGGRAVSDICPPPTPAASRGVPCETFHTGSA
jgi:hypothetical protein